MADQRRYEPCSCGDQECVLLFLEYHYCLGCHDHHRRPVATTQGEECPVDVMTRAWEAEQEGAP